MSEPADVQPKEIIIIKRRVGFSADAPKGGVWKIAFADFMTAMMAFFLVMWLISATSESTQQGVANYFNPIKLADAKVPRKGVRDPEKVEFREQGWTSTGSGGPEAEGGEEGENEGAENNAPSAEEEMALFRDPYAVLSAIAEEASGMTALHDIGSAPFRGATAEIDHPGQDRFRDPFDPVAWDPSRGVGAAHFAADPSNPDAPPPPTPAAPAGDGSSIEPPPGDATPAHHQVVESRAESPEVEPHAGEPDTEGHEALAAEVEAALAEALGESMAEGMTAEQFPDIEVSAGEDGVLISLTDEVDFGMFAIGSAEPRPETVVVMEKIARVLGPMKGGIIIRGHTDGRPFRSEAYDNWRLSTARAHMAQYMLLRGGLDESRILGVDGRADRELKVPGDPLAAENRRIDILLRKDGA